MAIGSLVGEFDGADLGDQRRAERLKLIAGQLEQEPAKGFPRALGSDAALEAFYRFINNDAFSAKDILAPHVAATMRRAAGAGPVIAVHDTTLVEFSTDREGLGVTSGHGKFGFVAHASLLLTEQDGLPLGVGYLETLTRTGKKWKKRKREGQRGYVHAGDVERESLRWIRGTDAVGAAGRDLVHVTDAEGDFFELLEHLDSRESRFVVRAGQLDRTVVFDDNEHSLREVAARIRPRKMRTIALSERKHAPGAARSKQRRHPNRSARSARVAIGAARVAVAGTRYSKLGREALELNVVRVWEPNPPELEPPVEWVLLTTERVTTRRELLRVVDIYRKRWVIEEYFKALKSGCSFEKRQIESYAALCKVLSLFAPIAYRLLLLRALNRQRSSMSARFAFSEADLELMQRAPSNQALAPPRTISDALTHLARLGGHLRSNGPPGWQTLAWGYEKLLTMRLGYEIAMAEKCDQS